MVGGMHPKRGPGVPLGERVVAGREELAAPVATSPAYRRLMGLPEPPRPPLDRQHVLVETDEGPAAGLLVELAGDRARVMYALGDEPESQSLLETWVHVDDVVEVEAPPPV